MGKAGTLSCFESSVVKGHLSPYCSMYEHICTYITKISAFLCTSPESNPRNRVLGGAEKDSFITLQAKGDTPGFCLKKTMCLNPSELDKGLQQWVKGGVSDKIRV